MFWDRNDDDESESDGRDVGVVVGSHPIKGEWLGMGREIGIGGCAGSGG